MIWIIEGPDGAGKSMLAEQIEGMTGHPIVHMDKPTTQEEKDNMFQMYMEFIEENDNAILDRAWYSEMVYGPIMREKSYITLEQMEQLEEALLRKGGIIIHCTGYVPDLWKRCKARGEDYITDIGLLGNIVDDFNCLFNRAHSVPVLRYRI